ncbi:MAG TPA: glycerophosphodiester phosphodiesterase [Firmicutes bacterium]|jgi:glycerophosphoryl diester phosphodiesterase|nr:MAG: hypothetical protein AA931_01660 [Peptococcaceae bacterium 1109]HHT72780.1 glycerophosphodiester phosphodiesterase [Bacillota bacterium]
MYVLAHRGYSGKAPENTMAAFKLALEADADGLELDVHITKDGRVVVIHDDTLERTTDGRGRVEEQTYAELAQLDAGSWFGEEFKGERLPTLDEVCELLKGTDKIFNVELKAGVNFKELTEKVAELIVAYDLVPNTIISSFNHYALAYMKQVNADIRTGILYSSALYQPWEYARLVGATALHPSHKTVVPFIAQGARENGMMVNPYTVDEPHDVRRMVEAGVDSIITNQVTRVKDLLQQG